jgi:hypothetical protein
MIVCDLHLMRIAIGPRKAYSELAVDADAMLPASIAGQRLKPIAGRNTQVHKAGGGVQHSQLAQGRLLNILREPRRPLAMENTLGFAVLE